MSKFYLVRGKIWLSSVTHGDFFFHVHTLPFIGWSKFSWLKSLLQSPLSTVNSHLSMSLEVWKSFPASIIMVFSCTISWQFSSVLCIDTVFLLWVLIIGWKLRVLWLLYLLLICWVYSNLNSRKPNQVQVSQVNFKTV